MASGSPASVQWERAQQVHISVDLISGAKQELGFLALVDSTPALQNRQVLEHAIDRYLSCWLPLASKYTPRFELLPPLDCAWVWHCHKLNPVQYAKDCHHLFGRLVDVAAPRPDRTSGEEASRAIWKNAYPDVPYHFVRAGDSSAEHQQKFHPLLDMYTVAYDLIGAIERQTAFYFQACRPWMYEDKYLRVALERYRGFLQLIKLVLENGPKGVSRPIIVPTYDIDLLWHSHQLCPTAYQADTVKCMGKILNHDDSYGNREVGSTLHTGFVNTCDLWLATYGMVYEHAGSLYRASKPARPAPPTPNTDPLEVVMGCPANQTKQPFPKENEKLLQRQTVQVNLVVLGAANVDPTSKSGRRRYFYIRVSALEKCPGLKLTTSPMECSSAAADEVMWNEGFSLQAELSTQGLRMELMSYTAKHSADEQNKGFVEKLQRKIRVMRKKPKCIGEFSIEWQRDLLNSTAGLSLTKWVATKSSKHPPRLHISVSITPPTPAPHIFRILPAPVTDDNGLQVAKLIPVNRVRQEGRWITRTVVDHTGQEQFVLRSRWATGKKEDYMTPRRALGEMRVHEGSLVKLTRRETKNYQCQPLVQAPPEKYQAHQLDVGREEKLDQYCRQYSTNVYRKWSFFEDAALLTVARPSNFHEGLNCELQGIPGVTGYPMRLLSGRWLEYEVADRLDGNEAKYLTLVRYTPDAPRGKATALINRESASIEVQGSQWYATEWMERRHRARGKLYEGKNPPKVKPEESVVFVLMLANAISMSLWDMDFLPSTEVPLKKSKQGPTDGHLGALLIKRDGLSDMWCRHSSNREPMYWEANNSCPLYSVFWWELNTQQIYSSKAYGAKCGGGACRAGTCGGGECLPDKPEHLERAGSGDGWSASGCGSGCN